VFFNNSQNLLLLHIVEGVEFGDFGFIVRIEIFFLIDALFLQILNHLILLLQFHCQFLCLWWFEFAWVLRGGEVAIGESIGMAVVDVIAVNCGPVLVFEELLIDRFGFLVGAHELWFVAVSRSFIVVPCEFPIAHSFLLLIFPDMVVIAVPIAVLIGGPSTFLL
jgi:hypothetical protein